MTRKNTTSKKHSLFGAASILIVLVAAFVAGRTFVLAQEWNPPQSKPPINNTGQPPGIGSFTGYLERGITTLQTLQSQIVGAKTSGASATLGGANGNIGIFGNFSFTTLAYPTPTHYPTGSVGVYGYATGSPYGLYAFGDGAGVSYGVYGVGASLAEAGKFLGPVNVSDNGSALGNFLVENGAVVAQNGIRCLEASGCIVPAAVPAAKAISGTHTAGGFGVYGFSAGTYGVSAVTDDQIDGNGETAYAFSTAGIGAGGYGETGGVHGITGLGDQSKTFVGVAGFASTTPGSDIFQARRGAYGQSDGGLGNKTSYSGVANFDLAAGVRACVKDAGGVIQSKWGVSGTGGRFSGYFDGVVSCIATPYRTVDPTGESGLWDSMVRGSNGFPLIVYRRTGSGIFAISCGNHDCSVINSGPHLVVSTSNFIDSIAVAVGGDGLPAIVYRDDAVNILKFVKCRSNDCSVGGLYYRKDIETTGVGTGIVYASIAIRPNNFPIISYHHLVNLSLKVIACGNADCCASVLCTNTMTSLVDDTGTVGLYSSIAINTTDSNLPVISYYRSTAPGSLEFAHCSNTDCTAATIRQNIDTSAAGQFTSIEISPDGYPAISYYDNGFTTKRLKFIKCVDKTNCCGGVACGTLQQILDPGAGTDLTGRNPSLAFGADGYPIVAYNRSNSAGTNYDLYVAKCLSTDCSVKDIPVLIDPGYTGGACTTGNAGRFLDLAIGSDGLPVMSYYDEASSGCTSDLKVAKCLTDGCEQGCYPQKSGDGGNVMIAGGGSLRIGNRKLTLKNLACILEKAGYTQYAYLCP